MSNMPWVNAAKAGNKNATEIKSSDRYTSNKYISEYIYRSISGGVTHEHWIAFLKSQFFQSPVDFALSPGCGDGSHEKALLENKVCLSVEGFDVSNELISISNAKCGDNGEFWIGDINAWAPTDAQKNKYGLVLFSGSLHHSKELEITLGSTHQSLSDSGRIVLNEYVGDSYNIWSRKKVDALNEIINMLPNEILLNPETKITNQTLKEKIDFDPSESVRSRLIPEFIEYYFDFEYQSYFGGSLLHIIYPLLRIEDFQSDDVAYSTLSKMLCLIDKQAQETFPDLFSDFLFAVGKKSQR
jgi:hypothetical protein